MGARESADCLSRSGPHPRWDILPNESIPHHIFPFPRARRITLNTYRFQ